ncbi:transposase [Streptomyces sp. NPDC001530]|uniref:transposase n=1 Tax=Streptomyces sp. NPDC001530 TaxID=3364582 RepID=UPI003690FB29
MPPGHRPRPAGRPAPPGPPGQGQRSRDARRPRRYRHHADDPAGPGHCAGRQVIGHVGDISRFPTEHHFASYTGSAPLDASNGNNVRHRLNTDGNRKVIAD